MLGAKDADNSTSRSGSFETLNILKVANYYQRCGSECATFTKDMNHEVAEGKKVTSAQSAFLSQIFFLHSCANLCCFFLIFISMIYYSCSFFF